MAVSFLPALLPLSRSTQSIAFRRNKYFDIHSRKCRHNVVTLCSGSDGSISRPTPDFSDVENTLVSFFTYKAVGIVLSQLHELDPHQYMWFYQFAANNNAHSGTPFIQELFKARQSLGERVLVTRLALIEKWTKRYSHSEMLEVLENENLHILRGHLQESIKFLPDEV